jgi:type IV secretory pathway VirB4 component
MLSESIGTGSGSPFENQHAMRMAQDADAAIAEAESGEVRFCYATFKIVLTADSRTEVNEAVRLIFRHCQNRGFDPRVETHNANEAWLNPDPWVVRRPQTIGK